MKWKAGRSRRSTEKYVQLTRQLVDGEDEDSPPLDLIIFPETALPFPLHDPAYDNYLQSILSLVREIQIPLLVGALESTSEHETLNRAFLIDVEGQVVGSYDKVHLVPFGEYLPLPWLFEYMQGLTAESGAFAHGRGFSSLPLPLKNGRTLPFGVFNLLRVRVPGHHQSLGPRRGRSSSSTPPTMPGSATRRPLTSTYPWRSFVLWKRAGHCCEPPTPAYPQSSSHRVRSSRLHSYSKRPHCQRRSHHVTS